MRVIKLSETNIQKNAVIFLMVVAAALSVTSVAEAAKWTGVDEAVIEKIAEEHGRKAEEPPIGKEQGDLLLFCFLVAGATGGFAAGYCWRMLITEKSAACQSKG